MHEEIDESISNCKIENNPSSNVLLFGNFVIRDKEGIEITNKFSPLLKELFCLILIYSVEYDKGININKLNEILWFDKTPKSARNNRGVNITKLRNLLSHLEGIELVYNNGFWKFEFDNSLLYCDYYAVNDICNGNVANDTIHNLRSLTQILNKGVLLHNLDFNWLDDFKSKSSDMIIDTIMRYTSLIEHEKYTSDIIKAANVLFQFDMINEEALKLKCKTLIRMGKHSLANDIFEKFSSEYVKLYGEKYDYSFQEIISS